MSSLSMTSPSKHTNIWYLRLIQNFYYNIARLSLIAKTNELSVIELTTQYIENPNVKRNLKTKEFKVPYAVEFEFGIHFVK